MSKGISLLVFLAFMILLPSCIKDELTLPAKLIFEFEMISHQEEERLKAGPPLTLPQSKMVINRGSIAIESIEFKGIRDEGRDVFFISNLPGTLIANLESGEANQPLSFDIPQGIYNRIELHLILGGNNEIPFVLEGNIQRGIFEEIPVRFEYNIREKIKIRAESRKQLDKIVLKKDTPSYARIVVDAGFIFQFVNIPILNNATISPLDDKEIILINPKSNVGLFNMMGNRLEKSFKVIIY